MTAEIKAHTTTLINAELTYHNERRILSVTSGTGAVSLSVRPNPSEYGDNTGTANLTVDQAEVLANDLLARVAEIRSNKKED